MSERPAIPGRGRVVAACEPDRLYEVEMPNGFRSMAVIPREGPRLDAEEGDGVGREVELEFSPYDMSRCRVVTWIKA